MSRRQASLTPGTQRRAVSQFNYPRGRSGVQADAIEHARPLRNGLRIGLRYVAVRPCSRFLRETSCGVVSLAKPLDQLGVDVGSAGQPDAMGEHRVEAARRLQPPLGGAILEDQPNIEAGAGRRLE